MDASSLVTTAPAGSVIAAVKEKFQAAGAAIAPLCSIDEVASFFFAAGSVSRGILNRAQHVAARCSERLLAAVPVVDRLLDKMGAMPHVEKLLAILPPSDGTMLMTDRSRCSVCGDGELLPMLKVEAMSQYKSGKGDDALQFMELQNGETLILDRKSGGFGGGGAQGGAKKKSSETALSPSLGDDAAADGEAGRDTETEKQGLKSTTINTETTG